MMASGKSAGGIVSFADGGTVVDGCKVLAGSEVYTGHHGSGGIAGALSGDSVIRNCDTEGVVGAYGGWAGGIVGFMRNGTVSSCVVGSHSAINGRMQNCGGIAGSIQPASNGTASVDACSVYCDISGQYSIGGITGYIETDGTVRISNSAYIKGNLYSTGANTSFYNLVAGIAGWVRSGDAGKGITIREHPFERAHFHPERRHGQCFRIQYRRHGRSDRIHRFCIYGSGQLLVFLQHVAAPALLPRGDGNGISPIQMVRRPVRA